jgi:hypothetical protein
MTANTSITIYVNQLSSGYSSATSTNWTFVLSGSTGAQGVQGLTGIQGFGYAQLQGLTGTQGTTGSQGATGAQGLVGTQGTLGTQGLTGTQGTQGTLGNQGTVGLQGVQGPLPGAPLTLTYNTSSSTDPLTINSSNGHGGTNFGGITTWTNNSSGATNGSKFWRINASGGLELINSAYSAGLLTIADNGVIGVGQAAVTSNLPTTNSIALNGNGYLFDDGNLHLHSSSGTLWINATDGSAVQINTQLNSGSGGLYVGGTISSSVNTGNAYVSRVSSGANTAFDTSLAMDNLNVRIHANGGSAGLIQASAVSGTFSAYITTVESVSGSSLTSQTNSSGISFSAGTWTSINAVHTISSGGDLVIAHIMDTTNSRTYRVTCMHGSGTTGGHITIERLA